MELHVVIGKDGFVREQDGRQSLDTVIADIIAGQYEHVTQVIQITPAKPGWPHHRAIEDVTKDVAWTIHNRCDGDRNFILYGLAAYAMVEHHVGIAHARTCLEREDA